MKRYEMLYTYLEIIPNGESYWVSDKISYYTCTFESAFRYFVEQVDRMKSFYSTSKVYLVDIFVDDGKEIKRDDGK